MSSAITNAGEALLALKQNQEQALVIDTFILANVAGIDPAVDVDRTEGRPDASDIVLEYTIPGENKGYINPNQVVYSMLLGSDIGDFTFNWVGLYSSADDTVVAIAYTPELSKWKTAHPIMGNALTRNFMLEYSGIRNTTQITVEASTWQIDFTARLKGIDERERLSNRDIYGEACFFGDGYLVVNDAGTFKIRPGIGYVEGVRIELDAEQTISPALPTVVFLDVALQPQGSDRVPVAAVMFADPGDYVDGTNDHHYGQIIASIDAEGVVTDCRPQDMTGALAEKVAKKVHNHPEYAGKAEADHTHTAQDISFDGNSAGLADVQDVEAGLNALVERTVIPTEAVAKNGTDNVAKMTALRVAQARGAAGQWQCDKGSTGYVAMPNGLIFQWGITVKLSSNSVTTITFPIEFPNACLQGYATQKDTDFGDNLASVIFAAISTTQACVGYDGPGTGAVPSRPVAWLAIGH